MVVISPPTWCSMTWMQHPVARIVGHEGDAHVLAGADKNGVAPGEAVSSGREASDSGPTRSREGSGGTDGGCPKETPAAQRRNGRNCHMHRPSIKTGAGSAASHAGRKRT
jgi:hypothetical protein